MWPVGMAKVPSSFSALPDPRLPSKRQVHLVEEFKRSLVRSSGIQPGVYSSLDSGLIVGVKAVYEGLTSRLLEELTGVDTLDLCIRLYKRNEELLGHILKRHHDLAARRRFGGSSESYIGGQMLWERLSPYTESIRWLIEVAVKYCASIGRTLGEPKFDRLVELARAIFEWDMIWETIVHKILALEVLVDDGFNVAAQFNSRSEKAREAYRIALMPGMAESEQDQFEMMQSPSIEMSIEEMIDRIGLIDLDEPLLRERGYSFSDWVKFSLGLIDSFGEREYFGSPRLERLVPLLSGKWKLDPKRLDYLLQDYGLSGHTLSDFDIKEMPPIEHARRDSRLLRRPVVLVERRGSKYCLYGIETVSSGLKMVQTRIESGRIDFVRQDRDGALRKAIGTLQERLGWPFERDIADQCQELGFENKLRKDTIRGQRLPEGQGFGPVDIFVIDRQFRRFVLVEAKNVADEGLVPREIKNEQKEFNDYLAKLRSQTSWFADKLADLKLEYGVLADEIYTVEGVIVVNRPRLWMFTHDHPLPIVDFHKFFELLQKGEQLATVPTAA